LVTVLFNYSGTFAVYASLPRSRVAYNAKAATLLYGGFVGIVVLAFTLWGRPFLELLPIPTLASIIFAASGFNLINWAGVYSLVVGVRKKRFRLEFLGFILSFILVFLVWTFFLL
jgi:MFS superfamily sulfate permease-like transporter